MYSAAQADWTDLKRELVDINLSLGYKRYVKYKQIRPGFELRSPCPFLTTLTITPRVALPEETKEARHIVVWKSFAGESKAVIDVESILFATAYLSINEIHPFVATVFYDDGGIFQKDDALCYPTQIYQNSF